MPTQRSVIRYREFHCPEGHVFRAAVRTQDDGSESRYRAVASSQWLPIPKCPTPDCTALGDSPDDLAGTRSAREFAQIPESERFYAWLSPDGERLSVPGYRGAAMPSRYARAGYMVVEGHSLRDLDRFDAIRSRQTGNDAYNEMSTYDAPTRRSRELAEATDDMTSDV